MRFLPCLIQRRQQHSRENCYDSYHNEQFYKGEMRKIPVHEKLHFLLG